jgi:hypothetical protein
MPASILNTSNEESKHKETFMNNEWHEATKIKTFPMINRSTGGEVCQVQDGTKVRIHRDIFFSDCRKKIIFSNSF